MAIKLIQILTYPLFLTLFQKKLKKKLKNFKKDRIFQNYDF